MARNINFTRRLPIILSDNQLARLVRISLARQQTVKRQLPGLIREAVARFMEAEEESLNLKASITALEMADLLKEDR